MAQQNASNANPSPEEASRIESKLLRQLYECVKHAEQTGREVDDTYNTMAELLKTHFAPREGAKLRASINWSINQQCSQVKAETIDQTVTAEALLAKAVARWSFKGEWQIALEDKNPAGLRTFVFRRAPTATEALMDDSGQLAQERREVKAAVAVSQLSDEQFLAMVAARMRAQSAK